MNNTKNLTSAIILMAAIFVVGAGTLAATMPSAAFAYTNKPGQNAYNKGGSESTSTICIDDKPCVTTTCIDNEPCNKTLTTNSTNTDDNSINKKYTSLFSPFSQANN